MVVMRADGKTLRTASHAATSVASLPKLPMPNSPNMANDRGVSSRRRKRRITDDALYGLPGVGGHKRG